MRAFILLIGLMILVGGSFANSQLPRFGLSYSLNFRIDDGNLTCPHWSIIDGNGRGDNPKGTHRLSAFDANGQIIYVYRFSLFERPIYAAPRDFFDENGTQIKFKDDVNWSTEPRLVSSFYPPYHPNATKLRVSDSNGTVLLEVDVSKYAHLDWQAIKRNRDEYFRNQVNQSGGSGPTHPPVNWTEAFYGLLILLAGGAVLVIGILIVIGTCRWTMRRIRPADKKTGEEAGLNLEKRGEENKKNQMEKKGLKRKNWKEE